MQEGGNFVNAQKAKRQMAESFRKFMDLGKESVKSRFFREYKEYQAFEKKFSELERKAERKAQPISKEDAQEILKMEALEEKRLVEDFFVLGRSLVRTRNRLEAAFLAAYAGMCSFLFSGLLSFSKGEALEAFSSPKMLPGFILAGISAVLYKATQRYYKAYEKMQEISSKHLSKSFEEET
ncbi:MAG: hypothetical protein N3F07_01350 [Candidatus Micrarchaeota archaeon]|nr:hypothetical protein [Candidatus Micrarchaeota archaeon]